jgi:hypothetical protein
VSSERSAETLIDPRGRFARCARCGWLERASRGACAQCGSAIGHEPVSAAAAVELTVIHRNVALSQCSLVELESLRAQCDAPTPELDSNTRRALEACDGRCALIAPTAERWIEAALAFVRALVQLRGAIAIRCVGSEALRAAIDAIELDTGERSNGEVFVSDDALSLDRAAQRAVSNARYCVVGAPPESVATIEQAFALYSLVAPEELGSRRAFLARFRGADAGPSARDAELGALLSTRTVRVSRPDAVAAGERRGLERWLDAAPQS